MANPDYDETNRGVLFRNYDKVNLKDERDTSDWANAQGSLNVYGVEFYISSWTKTIKSGDNKGDKMQQLAVKPKNEEEGKKLKKLIKNHILGNGGGGGKKKSKKPSNDLSDIEDMDDDLPF